MAPQKTGGGKKEDWETIFDSAADTSLPAEHRVLFILNSLILTAVPVCESPPPN